MSESVSARLSKLSPAQRELLERRLREKKGLSAEAAVPSDRPSAADSRSLPGDAAEPIAVVGAACRFPGANDLDSFWRLIDQGIDATGEIPASRWDVDRLYDATGTEPGKTAIRHGGFVDDIDQFDATFFGIAPREAARMDPQQRLLLQTVYHAIEHAGIAPRSMAGSRTGVFVGIGGTDYSKIPAHFPDYLEQIDAHVGTGNALSVAAGRISYIFDFHGPSFIVDTACSSALVALHSGVMSLRSGESDAAVVAGVNAILSPEVTIAFGKANMLSRDGRCRPFDASANGYVRGEGCGAVLIKRLSDARRDGDPIMGIIRGTAVNQDGRTSGITAPNGPSQEACIGAAMQQARITPEHISYVEAHGTATPLGDPIELGSLAGVFAKPNPSNANGKTDHWMPVRVTSVKANIGHTETVSGMAGLIKVLLMMRENKIPAQLHLGQLNPAARLSNSRIEIPTSPVSWDGGGDRIAGISSFGFGGTNAHVIVQAAETPGNPAALHPIDSGANACLALPISARSDESLDVLADQYARLIESEPASARDVCRAASVLRDTHPRRLCVVGRNAGEIVAGLRDQASTGVFRRTAVTPRATTAMLMTGQGSQYAGMTRTLYQTDAHFAASIDRAIEIVDQTRRQAGESDTRSLRSILFDCDDGSIDQTGFAQPAIVAVECAMVDRLAQCGVKPQMVCGHSVGEYAAACAAGVLSHADTMRLITHRGRLMQALPGGGAMVAVMADLESVQTMIDSGANQCARLSIAAINGPQSVVVSGPEAETARLGRLADRRGIACKPLAVSHAFHSELMDPMLDRFREFAAKIQYKPPTVPFYSSFRGRRIGVGETIDWAAEFTGAIRGTVRFADATHAMMSAKPKPDVWVEVGPTPHLIGLVRRSLKHDSYADVTSSQSESAWIAMCQPKTDADQQFSRAIAELFVAGAPVEWESCNRIDAPERARLRRVRLPVYAFDRVRHWMTSALAEGSVWTRGGHPLLGGPVDTVMKDDLYESCLSASRPALLGGHRVADTVVMPAAGLIEMGLAAGRQSLGTTVARIGEFEIKQPLAFPADQFKRVQTRVTRLGGDKASWQVFSRQEGPAGKEGQSPERPEWTLHAVGTVSSDDGRSSDSPDSADSPDSPTRVSDQIDQSVAAAVQTHDREEFYELLSARRLQYGPAFQVVDFVHRAPTSAVARIRSDAGTPLSIGTDGDPYTLHPGLLDGAMQLMSAISPVDETGVYGQATYMPVGVQTVELLARGPDHSIDRMQVTRTRPAEVSMDENEIVGDVVMADAHGNVVVRLVGVRILRVQDGQQSASQAASNRIGRYRIRWQPIAPSETNTSARPAVIDRPGTLAAESLADETSSASLAARTGRMTRDLMRQIQAWVRKAPVQSPVWVLTRAAVSLPGDKSIDPAMAAVWGMARSAQNEHPELGLTLVDVDFDPNDQATLDRLLENGLLGESTENQVVVRDGKAYAARLEQDAAPEPDAGILISKDRRFQIRLGGSNRIADLIAVPFAADDPRPDEVVVSVAAAGVNFSDVLKSMGLYPGITDAIVPLGIECSGIVRRVGADVTNFQPGDRVFGVVPYGFASEVTTPAYTLAKLPGGISMDEAATIPIAMMTAHYALRRLADLQPGERVLIHAGAGGVGMAAIQIAKRVGAEIFATAGSESKRDLLRQIGVQHVYDSRTLDFADQIPRDVSQSDPGGRPGIDVVLNSLPGQAIDRSLELLGPYGRFLEIGKTEIYQNRPMGLAPFQDNLSYHAIDLDRVLRQRPATITTLWNEILAEIDSGRYKPVPMTVFDVSDLAGAFRFMAARRNIGKVVVRVADENVLMATRPESGTCLITGGTGAIGLQLARHEFDRGHRSIALLSRRSPSPEVQEQIDSINARGGQVVSIVGDVAERASLDEAIASLPPSMPPIDTLLHAAGALDDGLLFDMTDDQLRVPMAAKVDGTENLLACLASAPVQTVVLFSSIASILGSPGQANYAAANAYLDATAIDLRHRGIDATSINFGPWRGAGMAGLASRQSGLDSRGIGAMPPIDALAAMDRLVDENQSASAAVFIADWAKIGGGRAAQELPSPIRQLVSDANRLADPSQSDSANHSLRDQAAAMDADERTEFLLSDFTDQLAKVMGLDRDQINTSDSLAAAGLDSLMAIELKGTIEKRFKVVLPMARFMEGPSLAQLAGEVSTMIDRNDQVTMIQAAAEASKSDPSEPIEHPLSGGQQSLWFLNRLAPDSAAYNIADAVIVHGDLDREVLWRAVEILVGRHESLRTTFPDDDGKPIARVAAIARADFRSTDATRMNEDQLRRFVSDSVRKPFDLACGPLLRIDLLRQSDSRHVLVFGVHHIVADFWSLVTMMNEFSSIYQDLVAGRKVDAAPATHQYRHFVDFQTRLLDSPEGQEQQQFWNRTLSGELPVLQLPTDRPRPPVQTFDGKLAFCTFDATRTAKLNELARQTSMTVNSLLLAAYQWMLHRSSGQDDVLIGLPTSGRSRNELAGVVGYFVNPVVVRSKLEPEMTLREFLASSSTTTVSALANQDYPLARIVDQLKVDRDASRSTLFQCMFVMQKAQAMHEQGLTAFLMGQPGAKMPVGDLTFESMTLDHYVAQFDLSLAATQSDDSVTLALQYNTSLFDDATANEMLDRITRIVDSMIELAADEDANEDASVADVRWLGDDEQANLVGDWACGTLVDEDPPLVHEAFERQVTRTPDSVAVIDSDKRWTYGELNDRSNRIAAKLIADGLTLGQPVGIGLPRSAELLAAMLGVLKAGGAYVPLDPNYPAARLRQILDQTEMFALLVDDSPPDAFQTHRMYDVREISGQASVVSNRPVTVDQDSPCYVIFTSGSTGQPKGAAVKHRGFGGLVRWYVREMNLTADDAALVVTSQGFDLTQKNFFAPLAVGGRVVMSEPTVYDPKRIAAEVESNQATLINATPSTVYPLADWVGDDDGRLASLRTLVLGGEPIDAARLGALGRRVDVYNSYGPTECSDVVAAHKLRPDDVDTIPLGRPIDNVRLYVLDARCRLVPPGVTGELFIGGDCVGLGYINDAEKTAQKFVADPFMSSRPASMYASGDLARWTRDGKLHFLGRRDDQIKIRGHRVELGEIESAITAAESVNETCVVLRRDDQVERLIAYVVRDTASQISAATWVDNLLSHLRDSLPAHAVPSSIVLIDALPLSPHGKVDRKQLPAPESSLLHGSASQSPKPGLETELAKAWASVLRVDAKSIGRSDNFFSLGGDSLLAITLVNRIDEAGHRVTPALLMQNQTVGELAACIERSAEFSKTTTMMTETARIDHGPTTPLQQRLLDQSLANVDHRHLSVTVSVDGHFDVHAMSAAVEMLASQHRALTAWVDRDQFQRYGDSINADELLVHASFSDRDQQAAWKAHAKNVRRAAHSIRIDSPGPIRFVVSSMPGRATRVTLIGHYLFLDPVSMRLLVEQWGGLLAGSSTRPTEWNRNPSTGPIEYAAGLQQATESGRFDGEVDDWLALCKPMLPAAGSGSNHWPMSTYGESVTRSFAVDPPVGRGPWSGLAHFAAIIADGLHAAGGAPSLAIDVETTGRNLTLPIDAAGAIGRLVSMFPVHVVAGQSADQLTQRLARIDNDGVGFGWLARQGSTEVRQVLGSLDPRPVRLNYLGRIAHSKSAAIEMIDDPTIRRSETDRANQRMHPIEIDVIAKADRWEMAWTFAEPLTNDPMLEAWIASVRGTVDQGKIDQGTVDQPVT